MTKKRTSKRHNGSPGGATPSDELRFDGAFWRSIAVLAVVYLAIEALLRALVASGAIEPLQDATAVAADWLLGLFGVETVLAGCALVTDAGTVTVEGSCLPVTPLVLGLALLIAATPGRATCRAAWSLVLVAALAVAGVVRIAIVAWLVDSASPIMAPVHETITPVALVAVSLGVWMAALRWCDRA